MSEEAAPTEPTASELEQEPEKATWFARVFGDSFARAYRGTFQSKPDDEGLHAQEDGLEDEGMDVNKKALIERLVAAGAAQACDEGAFAALDVSQLEKLVAACSADSKPESNPTVEKIIAAGAFTDRAWLEAQDQPRLDQLLAVSTASKPEPAKKLTDQEWLALAPPAWRARHDAMTAAEEAEKASLRTEIIAAASKHYTEADLADAALPALKKLHGALCSSADYSARGISAQQKDEAPVPRMPGIEVGRNLKTKAA